MKNAWRIWAKALGAKEGNNDCEADKVALVRTFIVVLNSVTCCFIIANALRHW